jgi:hypothetical protein
MMERMGNIGKMPFCIAKREKHVQGSKKETRVKRTRIINHTHWEDTRASVIYMR